MKVKIVDILNLFNKNLITLVSPIYLRLFLLNIIQNEKFIHIENKRIKNERLNEYLLKISQYIGFLDNNLKISVLGKYFCFSTDLYTDFYKLLTLKDEEFRSLVIDLIENKKTDEPLKIKYVSNFYLYFNEKLFDFFKAMNFIGNDNKINKDLLYSWKRNYNIDYLDRVLNILLNILNKINPQNVKANYKQISRVFNNNQSFKTILKKDEVNLIMNYEEFSVFQRYLEKFFKNFNTNVYLNNSTDRFINTLLDLEKKENYLQIRDYTKSEYVRNREWRDLLISIYKECQICSKQINKIPEIKTESGKIYLEVHHIIPLSLQTEKEKWRLYYRYNHQIENLLLNNLDNYKNMIVLCAHHHKMIHYDFPKWILYYNNNAPYFFNGQKKIYIKAFNEHYSTS
ncbi:MAG: HNH endonuclease [Candidatus Helarchaeota archaeon]